MRLSLDGEDWLVKPFLGEEWRWRQAQTWESSDNADWWPAHVPGSVCYDAWRSGNAPDPYFGRNSLELEWIPARSWVYRKRFRLPEYAADRVRLHFEGIDFAASVFLNGAFVGHHRGMFTPAVLDVTDSVRSDGENQLTVALDPPPTEPSQIGRTSRVRHHKARMTYGWDFCPRMIHVGLWDGVWLELQRGPRFDSQLQVGTRIGADLDVAVVSVSVFASAPEERRVEAFVRVLDGDEEVASRQSRETLSPTSSPLRYDLRLEQPELWWPNGHGQQHLYTAEIELLDPSDPGFEPQRLRTTFGVRRVDLVANEGGPRNARPYTFAINGRRVYANGWNWVPMDVLYGRQQPERLHRLLSLAQRANVNLLRVWGGGLIEREPFYELCDRYGLMVWQEFAQSSSGIDNTPSSDAGYVHLLEQEAEQIVPRKRHHPSLVVWCGGNELTDPKGRPLDDRAPVLGALHGVVERHHREAAWVPTSPSGPVFANNLENIERDAHGLHDVHGPWEHQGLIEQYTLYNKSTSLFHAEFGVEGGANPESLAAFLPAEHHWPATRDNPYWSHCGEWWLNEPLLQEAFGGGLADVATLLRASQFLQAEGLRYAIEANRRRAPRNSGSIPWQFNEPYPNGFCTAAVDYFTRPKAAYYAVGRAYAPLLPSARLAGQVWAERERFEAEAWVTNALAEPADVVVTVSVLDAAGHVLAQSELPVAVPAAHAVRSGSVAVPLSEIPDDLFFCDVRLSTGALSRYLLSRTANLAPLLSATPTTLAVSVEPDQDQDRWEISLRNTGSYAAFDVRLSDPRDVRQLGSVYFADNHVHLLPGEERSLAAEWVGVPAAERSVVVQAWNSEPHTLR